ncbi:MAG: LPS assembly lipoprotein LptE, partial [Aeromonas sp.]
MGTLFTRLMAMMLAALLLQGCGFHMRSHGIPKELMTMKVVGDNKSDFYRMVTTRLKASGV